jgi:D-alanine transaminase
MARRVIDVLAGSLVLMNDIVYVNGAYVPHEAACVSIDDRGFVFGDSIYEVVKSYAGVPFRLSDHLERMRRGAMEIRLPLAHSDAEFAQIAFELLERNRLEQHASIYFQVSRGPGAHTHPFPDEPRPTTVVVTTPVPELDRHPYEKGIQVITFNDVRWSMCHVKSVGLLVSVLAKQAAVDAGVGDTLFVRDGVIVEGASANFFGVRGGELMTHPEGPSILPGITRRVVLEIAQREGIPIREVGLLAAELTSIDEAFLTGTGTEVLPVTSIDGQRVGSGSRGAITSAIQERFYELTRAPQDAPNPSSERWGARM